MVLTDDFYRNTELPSFLWRAGSYQVLLTVHTLCWSFLHGLSRTETHGLPRFLDLLKSRSDYQTRRKGLITISNHISVLDDPLIWGVLPLSFAAFHGYQNHRWSFASHDLCFQGTVLSHFFTLGQTLPTHRLKHSPHGGLFQSTFTEGVRMLSKINAHDLSWNPHNRAFPGLAPSFTDSSQPQPPAKPPTWPRSILDPLSPLPIAPAYPSYPHDIRAYNAPSRYASTSHSWIHIFPEGFVHQTDPSDRHMRYFKWGVSRLILEPPEAPDLVPMFIEGTDEVMHESRTFPRFLPRVGKKVVVSFGAEVDVEGVFGDLRRRWREICDRENLKRLQVDDRGAVQTSSNPAPGWSWRRVLGWHLPAQPGLDHNQAKALIDEHKAALDKIYLTELGVISETLKYDPEVVDLRKECTRRVRDEVLKVRRSRGYPDEDPKGGLAETWKLEGPKREGRMEDGSWVKET